MKGFLKKGFTLAEVMVVAGIIFIALLALFGVYTSALILVVEAREQAIATEDLEDSLEYIKTLPFAYITESANGGFADNTTVSASIVGGFLLDNESLTVTYPQGIGADPIEIQVDASWTGKYGRGKTLTFRTLRSSGL